MNGEGALRPQGRPGVEVRAMADGSSLLIDAAQGITHAINGTAAFVWERCDGRHTVAEIGREVQVAFAAPPELILSDVQQLLRQFAQLGLLAPS